MYQKSAAPYERLFSSSGNNIFV